MFKTGTAQRQAPLLGRETEIAELHRAVAGLSQGSGQVIRIVGEPGIGKSSLLVEANQRAREEGRLVLSGRATEFGRNYPFGVFVDAIDPRLDSLEDDLVAALGAERAVELSAVFPSAPPVPESRPVQAQNERYRTHDAVRRLLNWLAENQPLVLSLDDLHWADEASIELLSHLLRHGLESPSLILLSYRPRQVSHQLATMLEAAERERLGDQASKEIELGALTAQQCRQLLDVEADELVDRLYRESGGNPFYLQQLARTTGKPVSDVAQAVQPAIGSVPARVAASIAGELEELTPIARKMLRAAAVVGEPFDPELPARVAEVSEEEALAALDELSDFDLVRASPETRSFRFRHPIVRRAVYESGKPGGLIRAHRRAAAALAERGAPAIARADHVGRSASPGDADAVALLTEAGHAAATRAPAAAASWFESALRLLGDSTAAKQQRLELLVPLAMALGSVGRLAESRELLMEVVRLLPREAGALRIKAVNFAAMTEALLARHAEAKRLLLKTLRENPEAASPEMTELKVGLAFSCFFTTDWEGMRLWATQVAQEADEANFGLRAAGASALGLSDLQLGEVESARRSIAQASRLIDDASDQALAEEPGPILILGWAEVCAGAPLDAERHMTRAIALSRRTGQGHLLVGMLSLKSFSLVWQGRLEEAARHSEDAIEAALLSSNDLFKTWAFTTACLVEVQRGNLQAAIRHGEEAISAGRSITGPSADAAAWYLAEAWLELGELERCREQLEPTEGESLPPPFPFYARAYALMTRFELERGDLPAAERWVEHAEETAAVFNLPAKRAWAHRARTLLLLATGNHGPAAKESLASVDQFDRAGARVDSACSRFLAGVALAESGMRARALEELQRAEGELSECGARGYREQAARELRRLGHRATNGMATAANGNAAELTSRQLEIAELVSAGKTNRQIAAQLYLSQKSVESHLTRIFSKLEVSSRAALAATVERTRIAPPA